MTTPPPPAPRLVLTREAFLAVKPALPKVLVPLDELQPGASVWVRGMTGKERDDWEVGVFLLVERERERVAGGGAPDPYYVSRNLRARLAAASCCDEAGQLLFGLEDADQLGRYPAAALDRVYAVARRLSLIEEQDVQELVGKAAAGGSSDAGTASRAT